MSADAGAQLRKAALYCGIYTRVAHLVGTDPSHVRRVALGQRKSPRISSALLSEIERIEAGCTVAPPPSSKRRVSLRCYFKAKNGDVFAQFYEVGGIRIRAKIGRASQMEVAS
jgi:hypothetical protein